MITTRTKIAVVAVVLIAAIVYEINETHKLQVSLAAAGKERERLSRQVDEVIRRSAEAEKRESVRLATPPSEPPRVIATQEPPVIQAPVETPGVTIKAPAGWSKNGSKPGAYVVGVDQNQTYAGLPSAYVKSLESSIDGFGGMMQMNAPDEFAGKRVRYSGWVKTEDANDGGAHLWFRVDGKQTGASLQFDNMDNRPIKGTTDWQQYSIVVDVPQEATALAYGFFVAGTGQMWVSGTKIEEVPAEVPSTNLINNQARTLPKTPVNLNFQ